MCGIEILLCCAAAGAGGGCIAKNKMDKKNKKAKNGVKGEGETYKKAKENRPAPKGKQSPPAQHRMSAYEEYTAKYPQEQKNALAELHHRPPKSTSPGGSPKGGIMDADEFKRLKQKQQKDKFKQLL